MLMLIERISNQSWISTQLCLCLLVIGGDSITLPALTASAQDASPDFEASDRQAPQFAELVGQVVDIQTKKLFLNKAKVEEVEPGKSDNSIKWLRLTVDGKRAKAVSSKIVEIYAGGQPLDVTYDRKQRCVIHDPQKRTDRLAYEKKVNDRLSLNGHRLWQPLTDDQQLEFFRKQEGFIRKIRETLPVVPWRQVETGYFIFLTDLKPAEVDGYIAYLDAMYEELCKAFGVPAGKNIWCGKCMVVALREKSTYLQFESAVMNFNKAENTQGLCHQEHDGSVLFAGYKGSNDFFGHVLVHETSHGFVHRYLSSARAPSWLNEGMADWLAHQVVKGDQIPRRQRASAAKMKLQGGWGDILTADRISSDHYGVSSVLVEILLRRDKGGQFKQYFDGIKEGRSAEECLKEYFGLSYIDLEMLYAKTVANWK